VEFDYLQRLMVAESEDLSKNGVFIRTDEILPEGTIVDMVVTMPRGSQFRTRARAVHVLSPMAARALGRHSGIGLEFMEMSPQARQSLLDYLDALIEATTPNAEDLVASLHVVLADPHTPLLVRLTNALEGVNSFVVDSVTNGADAFVACLQRTPDLVVAAIDMPFMNGFDLVAKLKTHERLLDIPIILMSADRSDMTRLEAYRIGCDDFIQKPFTDEELALRLRRLARIGSAASGGRREPLERAELRGSLSEISVATLLSLFEFEHKSGMLSLEREEQKARIMIQNGMAIQVEGPVEALSPRDRLMCVLDWTRGSFEFNACEVVGKNHINKRSQELLLEHARISDESGVGGA
jgi:DNA-binding response OmpR family regulator/Tfp pilus assembly protein PilZ